MLPIRRGGRTLGLLRLRRTPGPRAAFDEADRAVLLSVCAHAAEAIDVANALQQERDERERLQALDDMKNAFLSAVSHELRTPLSVILGVSRLLEHPDLGLSAPDVRHFAGRLSYNARKLQRLLEDLLDLDRLRRGILMPTPSRVDLLELIERSVAECEVASSHTVHLDLDELSGFVDVAKFERIVENLVSNAARHTPPATEIWVRLRHEDGGALLMVEDAGGGVPPELRERIFDPFEQGIPVPHAPGVGVGLAVVARFAELHGGRAWVQERSGGGASFRVWLPISNYAFATNSSSASPAEQLSS